MRSLPRIGITPDVNDLAAPETEYVVRRNYADAVTNAGGLPFILPYGEQVDEYLEAVDGLLVTGGVFDINPVLYRQTARKQYVMKPARTDFERALIKGALSRSMPILGICNGMQLLAVCLGGNWSKIFPQKSTVRSSISLSNRHHCPIMKSKSVVTRSTSRPWTATSTE